MEWVRFSVKCPSAAVEAVVGIMLEVTGAGPSVEDCGALKLVRSYVAVGPEAEEGHRTLVSRMMDIPAYLGGNSPIVVERDIVRDENWAQAWKEFYHPLRIGRRLVIKPSWEPWPPVDDPDAARPEDVVIELDPQMAFGTGTHPTTQLCLVALEDLVTPGARVLDVGCGSGILSLSAVLLGAASAVAVDVDPVAVETAGANAAKSGVGESVEVRRGDITVVPEEGFDLVVANINAPIVCQIASEAWRRLRPGGYFIASGIIETLMESPLTAIKDAGFHVPDIRRQEDWVAILGRRPD